MNHLKLCDELILPLDIITMRIAIYGTSGAGKTAFGRLLAEKIHDAGHRFCAIDLKNDWWGLKSSADGAHGAIPVVVFGGPRRDVQLFDDAGATVADTIASIGQSAIVDLDALSKGKQLKFVTAFLERLYDVNREPLMLLADEADRYAPQKAMSVEANISLGAAEDICRRGRKRGIGSTWLTQRTAVLNKNVADICDMTVVFRTPGSRDLKELEDRVARVADKDQVREVMRLAPGLADGQAIFLSSHPKLRDCLPAGARPVQLPLPRTFDSSSTPGVGKRRVEPKVLAKADLAEIEKQMAAQVERAKAEDSTALRRELADLKRDYAKLQQTAAKSTAPVKTVDRPVLKDGQLARAEKLCDRLVAISGLIVGAVSAVKNANMQNNLHKMHIPARAAAPPVSRPPQPDRVHGPGLGAGERRCLVAIAQHTSGVTAEQLTILTGYKKSSRNTYLQRLTSAGLAEKTRDRIVATEAGVAELGRDYERLPTGIALQDYWLGRLSGGEKAILQYVLNAHPTGADPDEMGESLGYKKSSRNTYLQRLQARELVTRNGGLLYAADQFFS
ncbi:MAG: hypothetical protein P4L99_27995 [Chthoniobacter sp.]|nr:hypothetical protein [Chthoniobacter sp.]